MSENYRREARERPKGVNLRIIKPERDKGYMVGFDAHNADQSYFYNLVIERYLAAAYPQFTIFHQVGAGEKTGYIAWEILYQRELDEEKLQKVVDAIDHDAKILLSEDEDAKDRLHEKWDGENEAL